MPNQFSNYIWLAIHASSKQYSCPYIVGSILVDSSATDHKTFEKCCTHTELVEPVFLSFPPK